jgi:hypothetical protein
MTPLATLLAPPATTVLWLFVCAADSLSDFHWQRYDRQQPRLCCFASFF